MRFTLAISLLTIATLAIMSVSVGMMLGDVDRIPMHWNLKGVPNSYAPKWTGLSVIPAIGLVTMLGLAVSQKGHPENQRIRTTITAGLIMIAVHSYFVYMVLSHANKS